MYQEFLGIKSNRYKFKIVWEIIDGAQTPMPFIRFLNLDSIELGSESEDESVIYPGTINIKFLITKEADDNWINWFLLSLINFDSNIKIYIQTLGIAPFLNYPQFFGVVDKDNINYDIYKRTLEIKTLEPINKLKDIPNTNYGNRSRVMQNMIINILTDAGCYCSGVERVPRFEFNLSTTQLEIVSEAVPQYNIINANVFSTYFTDSSQTQYFPNYASILKSICESLFCYGVLNFDRKFHLINRVRQNEQTYAIDWDILDAEVEFTRKFIGLKQTCPNFVQYYGNYIEGNNNKVINTEKQHEFRNEFVCGQIPNSNPPTWYSILYFIINGQQKYIWGARKIGGVQIQGLFDLIGWDYYNMINKDRIRLKLKVAGADLSKWNIAKFYTYDKFPTKIFRCVKVEYAFFEDYTRLVLVEA